MVLRSDQPGAVMLGAGDNTLQEKKWAEGETRTDQGSNIAILGSFFFFPQVLLLRIIISR